MALSRELFMFIKLILNFFASLMHSLIIQFHLFITTIIDNNHIFIIKDP